MRRTLGLHRRARPRALWVAWRLLLALDEINPCTTFASG